MLGYERDDSEGIMLSLQILTELSHEQATLQGTTKGAQSVRKARRMRKSGR